MLNYFHITESGVKQCNTVKIFILLNNVIVFCLAPGPPSDVKVYAFAEYILVTWDLPEEPNGVITGYRVGSAEYQGSQPQGVTVDMTQVAADTRRYLLAEQKELSDYVVEIQAQTGPGWGESVRKTTRTVKLSGKSLKYVKVNSSACKVGPFQHVIIEQFSVECRKPSYCKLWNFFFPLRFMTHTQSMWAITRRVKNLGL